MRRLVVTLAVAAGVLLAPTAASAAVFEVDTLDDLNLGAEACTVGFKCSLHDAIDRANETAEADEVTFGDLFAGKFEPEAALPQIVWPVRIDATTAADYSDAGHPVLLLSGEAISDPEARGLEIMENAGGSAVMGLAVGGFKIGIFTYAEEAVEICGNYLGLETDGETTLPNTYAGISTGIAGTPTEGARIGFGCDGNLISGNTEFGILEAGYRTRIAGNEIGVDVNGEPLPNGDQFLVSAGIEVNSIAEEPIIGGIGPGEGNLIAFNQGQGIRVRDTASAATIRANSIHSNLLAELQIDAGVKTAVPTLESVSIKGGVTTVAGTISGVPNENYAVDFFANASCAGDEPGGETYIGELGVQTDASGVGTFSAEGFAPVPPGSEWFTTTATAAATASTSTFSSCRQLGDGPPSPPPVNPPAPPIQPLVSVNPVNGESVAVAPVSGVVYVKLPGKTGQVKLTAGMLIPVGAVVDATKGKVTLTSVNKAGETQTAVFYGGKFLIAQQEANGLVVLKLRGVLRCGKARPSLATASAGRKGRRLWGSGKGKFRTEGNSASATVRGTIWLTEDRCDGTFVKVRKGVVSVRDFTAGQTFSLPAGKSYLAKSP